MDEQRRPNPHRWYRDREHGVLAGVCAGLADYLGWNRAGVRIATIIGFFVFMPFVAVAYLVLAIVLPKKPEESAQLSEEQVAFWRGVTTSPIDTYRSLSHRFRELDRRVQSMEAYVTSPEFEIDRELERSGKHSSA